jgi:hypothetical protein
MKWIYQPVRVDPGATYSFDAWIWQDDANVAEAFLRISWYASGDASGESVDTADSTGRLDAPSASFRQLTTGPVTAPADAHSAKLRIVLVPRSAARAAIVVDDVSFVPAAALAPAPAAAGAVEDDDTEHSAVAGRSTRRTTVRTGSALLDRGSGAHVGGATALVINEVLYDPDTASSDADGEWVEIYNTGAGDVSLVGWSLRDHARAVPLPDIVLPPHGFAVIAASDSFFSAYPGFDGIAGWLGGRIGNGLGNDGDLLELIAPDGVAVDAVSWGDDASALVPPVDAVGAGHSIERSPAGIDTNAAADFVDNAAPSPGRVHEADGANSKQQIGERTIEVLEASGESHFRWVPWALVALSGAALAGAVGWRALDAFRSRAGAT